jgi:nucleotidyltransferase substrate binding protein (TIGR01987 family)
LELDLTSLHEAVQAMGETLARAEDDKLMGSLDEVTQNAIRAGVIQHFEFTYELSWKFVQRWLRLNASVTDADPLTRRELFRTAARYGLIANPQHWFGYSEARNLTAHT